MKNEKTYLWPQKLEEPKNELEMKMKMRIKTNEKKECTCTFLAQTGKPKKKLTD